MNFTYDGGSSSVFRNALKAEVLSMCTSSMIYTLYFPCEGGIRTCSTNDRIFSTELFEAPSNSKILKELLMSKLLQEGQTLQASPSLVRFSQLMALAKIRATVVFPTP